MLTEQQREAAKELTLLINASEQWTDMSLGSVGEMLGKLPDLRRRARFPTEIGQPALLKLTAAAALLVEARGELIEAHKELAVGVTRMDGDYDPGGTGEAGPKPPPPTGALVPMRVA